MKTYIEYGGKKRLRCSKKTCQRPEGFCKHTIDKKYAPFYSEAFEKDPIQLSRSLAISESEKEYMRRYVEEKEGDFARQRRQIAEEWEAIKVVARAIGRKTRKQ